MENFTGSDLLDLFRKFQFSIDDLLNESKSSIGYDTSKTAIFYDCRISENPKIQLDNSWIFSISLYNEFNGLFTEQAVETKAGVNVKAQNLN